MNVKDSVAEVKARRAEQDAKEALSRALCDKITADLPDHIPMPTISNESPKARYAFDKEGVWLSFRQPSYGEQYDPVEVLAALEAAGFKPLPITLCGWERYTPSAYPGLQQDIPDIRGGSGFGSKDVLRHAEPISPLWMTHSAPHSRYTEAHTFYTSPSGMIVRLNIDVPTGGNGPRISARRVEYMGDWRYDTASIRLVFPHQWESVFIGENSQPVAQRNQYTKAYRSTEKYLNAYLYWTPLTEQDQFPATPSQFLSALLTSLKPPETQ